MVTLTDKTYQGMDIDEFTDLAYREGWSDGLPVLPPTENRENNRIKETQKRA